MTTIAPQLAAPAADRPTARRSRWPLYGTAAGVLGVVATAVTDGRTAIGSDPVALGDGLLQQLDPLVYRISMITGYAVVVLLLVLAAAWRRRVEPRVPHSTAARVVPAGLTASAAALTFAYGWKGALGLYLPGGPEAGAYDSAGLYVYYMLNDFGPFIGWLGVVVAAGAVAWMALRERTVSRWIGVFSALGVVGTAAGVAGLGVPGFPGLFGTVWMVVAFTGLAVGRSTITR